ncbi:MAG: LCP family protein, partial [Acidimicrobiales bacterium]
MAALAQAERSRPSHRRTRRGTYRRRRPRWLSALLTGLIVVVALGVVASGTAYLYLRHQLGQIKRIDIPDLAEDQTGSVMNVLLVGSDSRSKVGADLAQITGAASEGDRNGLSDTIMVLHVDPKTQDAAILSIPRDLLIHIDGTPVGTRQKINSAFAIGGAPTLVKTIRDGLGIDINHYVEVDFQGFENVVNTVGGVNVYLDAPARDDYSGLDLPEPGCIPLDGYQALAYVRSRYYESYEAGRWVADPSSDFGRIKRQQDFIRRMMRKAVSQGLTNPLTLNRLVSIGVNNVTLDSGMSTRDIVTVAKRFRSLDPDSVDMQTLPTEGDIVGGASVQLLIEEEAQPLIDRINGKAPPGPVRPSDVQVRVLNGNGGEGTASKTGFALQGVGFAVNGTGDADSFGYTRSVIRYAGGKLDKANLLRSYLSSGALLEEDHTLGIVDVALVVGSDFTGVRPSPAGPDVSSP